MAYRQFRRDGVVFVFSLPGRAGDAPPHIVRADGGVTTVDDALDVFFDPLASTIWDEDAGRFETCGEGYGLFWFWLDERRRFVVVITCFDLRGGSP